MRAMTNSQILLDTAKALVADNKGLLAMDESNSTCNKRFARLGIPQTEEGRRDYRDLIVSTPNLSECISGAILFPATNEKWHFFRLSPDRRWPLTFSFSRAIQQPALEIWRGMQSKIVEAQQILLHRARCNHAARCGEYSIAMEDSSK